ncbi:MAG: hypothetical protein R3199_04845 [Gemmatimonadota bacterium]|nr:hypothetical protein [Gemmatimonadota bacterium]
MTERCGVVIAHGRLADGLLSAVAHVVGPQENLWGVSNDGKSGEDLAAAVADLLEERGAGREVVLFSDLGGGSCGQVCRRLLADGTVRAVFFGANLPMLVEFVFLQDRPFDDFVDAMTEKSRSAVGVRR